MSVYMGEQGLITLQRSAVGTGANALATNLEPADVVIADKRFSADFPTSALINGDRIEIATQGGENLELVAGHAFPDGYWYCHVDAAGGIRLYDSFGEAVTGAKDNALTLIAPSATQPIYIRNRDETYQCVAKTTDWSLTTQRESVDLTVLGENFRDNYANGLISGQGETTAFWEYRYGRCESEVEITQELSHYYAQLLLRLEQGALFKGRFFIYACSPAVWYEADCVVTSVGFAFTPGQPIRTSVQFVTTGEIKLIMGEPERFLLQEDVSLLLQENDSPIRLEEPD